MLKEKKIVSAEKAVVVFFIADVSDVVTKRTPMGMAESYSA